MPEPETYFEWSARERATAGPMVIVVQGLDELQEALKKFPSEWEQIGMKALGEGMALIASDAKQRAPVDQGRLMSSIGSEEHPDGIFEVSRTGSQIVGKVGSRVEYASYQEYGTRYQSGKPYLRPALEAKKDQAVRIIERSIANILKRLGL